MCWAGCSLNWSSVLCWPLHTMRTSVKVVKACLQRTGARRNNLSIGFHKWRGMTNNRQDPDSSFWKCLNVSKSTHILHRHAAHRKFSTDCGLNSLKQKGFHSVQLDQRTKSNHKHSQAFKKHVCLRKNFSLCLVSLNKLRREPVVAGSFAGTCRHCVAVSYLFFQDYLLILFVSCTIWLNVSSYRH